MRLGDEGGKKVVNEYIDYLACGVASMIHIFQPDVLCIGGGVSKEGDNIILPLREKVAGEIYKGESSCLQTKICVATLGNDAGIIGAACLENMY